jgi:hypothetical protein
MLNLRFKIYLPVLFSIGTLLDACSPTKKESTITSLRDVTGITFIETRREFDTGLSFSQYGFQQVPEWTLRFLPGDSVEIYSPYEKKFLGYPIYYDHHDVVNFAREWLRIKHVSKDSLVLQLLVVKSKQVLKNMSTVYMKFYSEDYIKNRLKSNSESLRKPNRRDSLFVKSLIKRANSHPGNSDSVFFARIPVKMKSLTPDITVQKDLPANNSIYYRASNEYWNPEYTITIDNAYKDFGHSFTAFVDSSGRMTVSKFAVSDPDFDAPRRRVLQGIIDVYLHRYLKITPGTTFGIPHSCEIMLHVSGKKY